MTVPMIEATTSERDHPRSLLLEPLTVEFEGPAVLGHGADQLIGRPIRESRLDLDRDRHLGTHLTSKMGDNLIGNAASIASDAR